MGISSNKRIDLSLFVLFLITIFKLFNPTPISAELCLNGNVDGGIIDCGNASCECSQSTLSDGTIVPSGCQCATSGYTCQRNISCQSGEYPDWTAPRGGCRAWSSNGGMVCGNAVRDGGSTSCAYLCDCPDGPDCVRPCKFQPIEYATCLPICGATAPTNLVYNSSTQTLTWTPGSGGSNQRLYVGTNPTEVNSGCPGTSSPACVVSDTSLTSTQNSYSLFGIVSPGTIYYAAIDTYATSSCSSNKTTSTLISSCALTPSGIGLELGETTDLTTSVSGTGLSVTYSSNNSSIVSATASDNTYPYTTAVTGNSLGTATITNVVTLGANSCTDSAYVTVIPPQPWWQVKDSDISSIGNLSSAVNTGLYFDLDGSGGFPGVPAYTELTDLNSDTVSTIGWLVNTPISTTKEYDYAYFKNQIPKDTSITTITDSNIDGSIFLTQGTESYGYYWYKFDGSQSGLDLVLNSNIDLGDRKVILLIESADLYINGTINLTDGQGFFMTSVGKDSQGNKGNIYVSDTVGGNTYDLEGIYQADGTFNTGQSNTQLKVRGSVVGYDSVALVRDLTTSLGNGYPSEFFEYAPDQIMLYPTRLGARKISWKEVAP